MNLPKRISDSNLNKELKLNQIIFGWEDEKKADFSFKKMKMLFFLKLILSIRI